MAAGQTLLASARDPAPRERLGENRPEQRRSLILAHLALPARHTELVEPDPEALAHAERLGVVTREKLGLLLSAHQTWAAAGRDSSFVSSETADGDGVVPYFFVRAPAAETDQLERRLAWHATDALAPIFADLPQVLSDDAAVCRRAAAVAAGGGDVYALTTTPGHHATADHYGGYCFVNWAVFLFRMLRAAGRRPFLLDVDYHAGDGSATFLAPSEMVSLHAPADYPYLPAGLAWAVDVPANASWASYERLLRLGLARRPEDCDVLVLSLGFDTLGTDPDARDGQRCSLTPTDFATMRQVLRGTQIPLVVVQEGGYSVREVPLAAGAFWAAGETGAT